jgi:GNAT superfamily N-acetyltransferase
VRRSSDERAEQELDLLVAAFADQTLPKSAWNHAAHLRVACCYLLAYDRPEALRRLRTGIRALNDRHGVANSDSSGYHESLTRLWLALISHFVAEYELLHPLPGRVDLARAIVEAFAGRVALAREYWTFDAIRSVAARRTWIAPDALPLDVVILPVVGESALRRLRQFLHREGSTRARLAALAASRPDLASLREPYAAPAGAWFLALRSSRVTGCVAVQKGADGNAYTEHLFVGSSQRGVATARLLISAARQWAKSRGCAVPQSF